MAIGRKNDRIVIRLDIPSLGDLESDSIDILPPPNAIALWQGIPTLSAVAHFS